MAFPTPPTRTLAAKPEILPTVAIAPPPGLVPSRSLHVPPLAWIPLIISCLIISATTTYVWKLWQREDKYYVEEEYSDEEYEDVEATIIDSGTISGTSGRQSRLPETLIAAREQARAATLRSGISRPFAARTMRLNPRDQAWIDVQTQKHDSLKASEQFQVPPEPPRPHINDGTARNPLDAHGATSHSSIDTWERNSDMAPGLNGASAGPPQVSVQDHDAVRSAVSEAGTDFPELPPAEYDIHRMSGRLSGIDWKDEGSSIQGSEFTKYGTSEFDRSSYTNRYEDY